MFSRSVKGQKEGALRDEEYSKTSQYEKNFKSSKKLQDPRFGEVSVMANPATKEQILMKERKYSDKIEAGKGIVAARNRILEQGPYSLKLLDYSVLKQSELCSTIYILKQFWEFPGQDLRKEMLARQGSNNHFTELELSKILYQLLKSNPLGSHGDINPFNITFDHSTGNVKLIDRSEELPSMQRTMNQQKTRMASNQSLYMSPTMYSNLKRNNLKFSFDPSKEDGFALGLVLLELGNLKPISNIYDIKTKELNRDFLMRHVEEFRARYGHSPNSFLWSNVEGLTRAEETSRKGIKDIVSFLPNETEFHNSLVNRTVIVQTTTQPLPQVVQVVETTTSTVPVVLHPIPSIRSTTYISNNALNRSHSPGVHVTFHPSQEFKQSPPPILQRSVSNVSLNRMNQNFTTQVVKVSHTPIKETLNRSISNMRSVEPIIHEYHTGGSIISPRVIHDYRGNDINISSSNNSSYIPVDKMYSVPQEVYVANAPTFYTSQSNYTGPTQYITQQDQISYNTPLTTTQFVSNVQGNYPQLNQEFNNPQYHLAPQKMISTSYLNPSGSSVVQNSSVPIYNGRSFQSFPEQKVVVLEKRTQNLVDSNRPMDTFQMNAAQPRFVY